MSAVPASRVEVFDVLVPAGTTQAAPLATPTPWAAAELVGIEIVFPDGCAGLVGARVAVGGSQAIPTTAGAWLLGNAETLSYPMAGQLNNGAYSIIAYNTDVFPHTLHVRYLLADFGLVGSTVVAAPTQPLPS